MLEKRFIFHRNQPFDKGVGLWYGDREIQIGLWFWYLGINTRLKMSRWEQH